MRKIIAVLFILVTSVFISACSERTGFSDENSSANSMPEISSSPENEEPPASTQQQSSIPESLPPQESSESSAPSTQQSSEADKVQDNGENTDYSSSENDFELPLVGATGYASVDLAVYATAQDDAITSYIMAGTGFSIVEDAGERWYVRSDAREGYVLSSNCMLNLPDVIPSIIYNNTNTYSSLFKSSGIDIPNVTGLPLYQMSDYNDRLGKEEYIMPVMYDTAKKIATAQALALAEGNCIVIYETFRPASAHNLVDENFRALFEENETVQNGILKNNFPLKFFLAPAPYNHQRGTAMDASLARVDMSEEVKVGDYFYTDVTKYTEYEMQTQIHELSVASAIYSYPVQSNLLDAWVNVPLLDIVTEGSALLQKYCTEAGLTPLASEWWHFNDLKTTSHTV